MNAQEFVQYMPPSALADTVTHITETLEPDQVNSNIVAVCFRQLVSLVGEDRAVYMVFGNNDPDPEIDTLLDVVS